MKRISILSLFAALLAISYVSANETAAVSGQGKMKFKVLYKSDHLPPEAQKVLKGAHGGFSVDLAKGKGETYFALKGAGIIQISADLKSARMIDTPEEMKNTNLHNTTIWHAPDAKSHLMFPGAAFSGLVLKRLLDIDFRPDIAALLLTVPISALAAAAGWAASFRTLGREPLEILREE